MLLYVLKETDTENIEFCAQPKTDLGQQMK